MTDSPSLRVVENTKRVAPYPDDVRAGSYAMSFDVARVLQSDTFALCPAELRPLLCYLWIISWQRVPCATLPNDDNLIASLIGISPVMFATHRNVFMRGWQLHDDNRFYHDYMTGLVLEMLRTRRHLTERQRRWRAQKASEAIEKSGVTRLSRVNNAADVDGSTKTKALPLREGIELSTNDPHNALRIDQPETPGNALQANPIEKDQTLNRDRKPRPGESTADFVDRMATEIAQRKGAKA